MASGKLGSADLSAATVALLYTVPAGKTATVNVRFANRTAVAAQIRLAIGTGETPDTADYLTYGLALHANGIVEETGLALSAGEKVWVYSSAADVSVRAHGFEE